jgi:adenosylcobinamide kinase/adenosylcobinamide-phosphate guanylyltransferase
VTFVLGGVRSGKSRYAQQLAAAFSSVAFVATARASDAEMRRKIAAHRHERPAHWQTIEAPLQIGAAVRDLGREAGAIVVDCLTAYVANEMFTGKKIQDDALLERIDELCNAIQATRASVIIVSNEVGSGIVPAFRSGRLYRELLGAVNQRVAEIADRVVLMVAGLPVTIKGQEVESC